MMRDEIRNTIERFKIKAERFLKNNSKTFIVDVQDTYYFCYVVAVREEEIHIQNFKGPRKCEKERIFWEDIVKLEEYKNEGIENEKIF